MIEKAPDAYRTISEVAEDLDLPQHVLRFWETRFSQIKPLKRGGGRRYYRPDDVELLKGIRHLLYGEGYTIKGVQRILKEQGPKAVQVFAHSTPADGPDQEVAEDYAPQLSTEPPPSAPVQPAFAPAPPPPPVAVRPAQPAVQPSAAPVYAEPPLQAYRAPEFQQPAPVATLPAAPQYAPPPPPPPTMAAPAPQQTYPGYAPAEYEPPAAPILPPQPPRAPAQSVSYMRGGLLKPVIPAETIAPLPASVHQGYSVRKPKLPIPQPEPDPLDVYGGGHEESGPDEPFHEPVMRTGLSDESRRALQSAMFELTECRRVIERITAARDR